MKSALKRMIILKTPETAAFAENVYAHIRERLKQEYAKGAYSDEKERVSLLDTEFTGEIEFKLFRNGEIKPVIKRSVRGMDVYLLHSFCGYDKITYDPNIGYMKLFLINDALKRAKAAKVMNVFPHMPYQRQDRKDEPRVPISARLLADLTEKSAGEAFDGILTTDMHSGQQQGYYNEAVDSLECAPLFMNYYTRLGLDPSHTAVVSPDAGGAAKMNQYADRLGLKRAILHKQRPKPGEVSDVMHLTGEADVSGSACVLIDDIVDSGGTIIKGAERLRKAGAGDIYLFATHWIATDGAEDKFRKSGIRVVTTDSIPRPKAYYETNKDFLTVLSVAPMFADAIHRSQIGESLRPLYAPEYVKTLHGEL